MPVDCFGGNTGETFIELNGGNPPYSIDWGNNDPTLLSAGQYEIIAEDSTACQVLIPFEITEPTELLASTQITCSDQLMDVEVFVEGGSPPYQYLWSNGSELSIITGVIEGTVLSVEIIDMNGCAISLDNVTCPLSVDDLQNSRIKLFPNPCQINCFSR